MEQKVQKIKIDYIGKIVRVTTMNDRVFYGKFIAFDDKANLLINEAISTIDKQLSQSLNHSLMNALDQQLKYQKYIKTQLLTNEQKAKLQKQFNINKYYFGPIMIAGTDIKKIQIQKVVQAA